MAQILIRGLDEGTVKRLKERARRNGRSLQAELKRILERTTRGERVRHALEELRGSREALGRSFDDSAALIREDRER